MEMEKRPNINSIQSADEFRRWYWLKEELVTYCREHKIPYSAGKFELIERIAQFMDTGKIAKPKRKRKTSSFDWATESLTLDTVITDSYKNNQNVRAFMTEHIGSQFSFNIDFMAWMKGNIGKTLADAIEQWQLLEARKTDSDFQTDIKEHNQYNQYLRDFFENNPHLTIKEARKCWDYKRALPSDTGRHIYEASDLATLDD